MEPGTKGIEPGTKNQDKKRIPDIGWTADTD